MIKYLFAISLVIINLIFLCLCHINLSFNFTAIVRIVGPIVLFYFLDPVSAFIIVEGVLDSIEPNINRNNIGYHVRDKILDLWGYFVSFIALWTNIKDKYLLKYRISLTILFLIRLIGNISFIISRDRRYLAFFPNLYVVLFILLPILGGMAFTPQNINKIIILICFIKIIIEYVHHGSKLKEQIKPLRRFMKHICPGKSKMYQVTGTYPLKKETLNSKTPLFKL